MRRKISDSTYARTYEAYYKVHRALIEIAGDLRGAPRSRVTHEVQSKIENQPKPDIWVQPYPAVGLLEENIRRTLEVDNEGRNQTTVFDPGFCT